MKIRNLGRQTIGDIKEASSLLSYTKKNPKTYEAFNTILHANKRFDFGRFLQEMGGTSTETVKKQEDYAYTIVGAEITSTSIEKYECNNAATPGINGEIFDIYTKHNLFSSNMTIAGPSEIDRMIIVDEHGQAGGLFKYSVRAYGCEFIQPAVLDPKMKWNFLGAPTSAEYSTTGPGVKFMGAATRVAGWNTIRVQDTEGSNLENLEANVYDIKTGNQSIKIFSSVLEEKIKDLYYEAKANAIEYGKSGNQINQPLQGSGNKVVQEADGLRVQRGDANKISANEINLDLVESILEQKSVLSKSTSAAGSSYVIKAGKAAYNKLTSDLYTRYGDTVVINASKGQAGLVVGFAFTEAILPSNIHITIVLDDNWGGKPMRNRIGPDNLPLYAWDVDVYPTGSTNSGPSMVYRTLEHKDDKFAYFYGPAGTQGNLPQTLEDSTTMLMLGSFQAINRNPSESFSIELSVDDGIMG